MHVLLLTPEFGGGTGGIGTSLAALSAGLRRLGHRVTVVTRGPVDPGLDTVGCRVARIPCPPGHLARWAFRFVADATAWSARPDVVHAPEWGALAAPLALASRVPVVTRLDTPSFWVRELNGRPRPTRAEWLVERAEASQARASRLVLPASAAVAELVRPRWGLQERRLRILPYPVDGARLRAVAARSWPAAARPGGIVYIGRLETRKGLDVLGPLLLDALTRTDTHVTVVGAVAAGGHEPAAVALRQALAGFGDRVTFLGRLWHGAAMAVVAAADLVVVPSVWENSPLVVIEAMTLGRTVVAAAVGGIPELVADGSTGFLVRGRRPVDWSAATLPLLADAGRRAAVGRRARAAAAAWDVDAVARRAAALYAEAAA